MLRFPSLGGRCILGCGLILGMLGAFAGIGTARANGFRVLYSFCKVKGCADGSGPNGDLFMDSQENLYGTTFGGGNGSCFEGLGCGVIFELSAKGDETTLYSFKGGASDGSNPAAGLVADAKGNLYGTTFAGGGKGCGGVGCGTVYRLTPDGTETVLYAFAGAPDGSGPQVRPAIDEQGNIFGTTESGGTGTGLDCQQIVGSPGCGTVFELQPNGTETVLYSFKDGSDGAYPSYDTFAYQSGVLYGTTRTGGRACFCGTIFSFAVSKNKLSTMYKFRGGKRDGSSPDSIMIDGSGELHGTTAGGGPRGCGAVYSLGSSGDESIAHFFNCKDGDVPDGTMVMDESGNLYGLTKNGGKAKGSNCLILNYNPHCGTIFALSPSGTETLLRSFKGGSDGKYPGGGLTLDQAGNLYGTTPEGGSYLNQVFGGGIVFAIPK